MYSLLLQGQSYMSCTVDLCAPYVVSSFLMSIYSRACGLQQHNLSMTCMMCTGNTRDCNKLLAPGLTPSRFFSWKLVTMNNTPLLQFFHARIIDAFSYHKRHLNARTRQKLKIEWQQASNNRRRTRPEHDPITRSEGKTQSQAANSVILAHLYSFAAFLSRLFFAKTCPNQKVITRPFRRTTNSRISCAVKQSFIQYIQRQSRSTMEMRPQTRHHTPLAAKRF